jgi:surfactin synthase thioesterase subunit
MKFNPWFVRQPSPDRRFRLFCFAYAGGSAASFAAWQAELDPAIEVCAIQLPGRGSRFGESPCRSMPELVLRIAEKVAGQNDLPFAFFGHSLGALMAYEVACYCARHGLPMPEHLFASGCNAPQMRSPSKNLHLYADAHLISALHDYKGTPPEVLRNLELMNLLLPMVRADFSLAENYQYHPRAPLGIPVSVLAGRRDEYTTPAQVEGWQRETSGPFSVHWFDGDHFFLNDERRAVLDCVGAELNELQRA